MNTGEQSLDVVEFLHLLLEASFELVVDGLQVFDSLLQGVCRSEFVRRLDLQFDEVLQRMRFSIADELDCVLILEQLPAVKESYILNRLPSVWSS